MENIILGKGNLDGKGVYAAKNFRKNEIIIKYRLKPLSDREYLALSESEKGFVHTHKNQKYLYGEPERYVNHSENPNTYQNLDNKCDIAFRDIQKGEMITTDSSKDDIS